MAVQAAIFSSKKSGSGIFDCAIWELFEQKEAWGDKSIFFLHVMSQTSKSKYETYISVNCLCVCTKTSTSPLHHYA